MKIMKKSAWQVAMVATGLIVSSAVVSAMPGYGSGYGYGYGYGSGYGKYDSPNRGHYAPHRAYRRYGPYRRYGYLRPYRAYGRYAPYAPNAYGYQGQGASSSYAYDAKPRSQAAGYGAMSTAQEPKKTVGDSGETRVNIANMRFSPAKITVEAGETVTWTQSTSMPHTVTANDGSFDSPTLGQNREFSVTFDEPGSYSYFCKLHPSMTGEVEVL